MQNFQCADNNESQRHGKVGKAFQDELPVATLLMPMYGDGLWFEHGSSTITNKRVLSYRASQLHRNLLKLSNEYKLVMELSTPERSIESKMACLSEVGEGAFGTIFHVCDQNGCGGGGGE